MFVPTSVLDTTHKINILEETHLDQNLLVHNSDEIEVHSPITLPLSHLESHTYFSTENTD